MTGNLAALLFANRDRLPIFTVYERPADFPEDFVARLWLTLPEPVPTTLLLRARDLDALRDELASLGLVRLERNPEDEPQILETWI